MPDTPQTITIPKTAHLFDAEQYTVLVYTSQRPGQRVELPQEAIAVDPLTGDIVLTLQESDQDVQVFARSAEGDLPLSVRLVCEKR